MYKKRVTDAISAIKNGEMIIIMDDEDRENEGDLVFAGIFSTPQKINFMAQEACGLICVCVTDDVARKLDLPPMVRHNSSNHETAFTISIDAREAKTGISAYERDMTIRLMCEPNATPQDFVRPGHIFPLIAKEGGTLVRTGHTEAGVDICRLAGVLPIAVICEIMKKDGSMARRGDKFLLDFSKKHNIKILYVSDIIQYRLNYENLVSEISSVSVDFMGANALRKEFRDHLGRIHTIFSFECKDGACRAHPLVKFHTIRTDLGLLSDFKDYSELVNAIKKLQNEGGYLVFLQNGALVSKDSMESISKVSMDSVASSASAGQDDIKGFGVGAQILKSLGIKDFRLLSSNKSEYTALRGFNLKLIQKVEV